jgi:hypothetical protein
MTWFELERELVHVLPAEDKPKTYWPLAGAIEPCTLCETLFS